MRTFRRDRLRRLVAAGRVEVVANYHYDDMTGAERNTAAGMPVAIQPDDWHDIKEGICYLHPSDFTSASGRAWENPDGTVVLYVHSNCDFTLRILPEVKP